MALASIVVPNYNGVRHFPALFDALSRQRYRNFEVILVDDASTDQSLQWLENIRQDFPAAIQIVRNTNNLDLPLPAIAELPPHRVNGLFCSITTPNPKSAGWKR